MTQTTGAKFFANSLKAYGVTHVFVAPSVANLALAEASAIGVKSIVPHGEKAAANTLNSVSLDFVCERYGEKVVER